MDMNQNRDPYSPDLLMEQLLAYQNNQAPVQRYQSPTPNISFSPPHLGGTPISQNQPTASMPSGGTSGGVPDYASQLMAMVPKPPATPSVGTQLGMMGAGFALNQLAELLKGDPRKEMREEVRGRLNQPVINQEGFTSKAIQAGLPQLRESSRKFANRYDTDIGPVQEEMFGGFYQALISMAAQANMEAQKINAQARIAREQMLTTLV